MPKLSNPGPWSVGVFAAACAVVVAMFAFNVRVPEAGKVALTLLGIAGAWLSRSALEQPKSDEDDTLDEGDAS
jgi:hypothetical protein